MAFSQGSSFVSQLFSRTRTVSHNNQVENGRVEFTSVLDYKTAAPPKFDPIESPYGPAKYSFFGSQYGMPASKGVKPIGPPYGQAKISVFGPQYGIAALSREEGLHNDSEGDGRNHSTVKKAEDNGSLPRKLVDDSIPESWRWEYDAASGKYDIVYNASGKQTKPEAKAMSTQVSDSSLQLQAATPKWEVDELDVEAPWSFSSSNLHQSTNEKFSPRTLKNNSEMPMNPFIDSTTVEEPIWDIYDYSGDEKDILATTKTGPTNCIVCTDDFSATLRPPGWISVSCLHEPSVCCECLARCIKNDLESKIWNQITCPECKTLLVYEDIRRLADPETFGKYFNPIILTRKRIGTYELLDMRPFHFETLLAKMKILCGVRIVILGSFIPVD